MDFREIFATDPVKITIAKNWRSGVDCEVACFVPTPSYTENFSKQWHRFRGTQLDSLNGTSISRDFLEQLLGQPLKYLTGKTILEVGAGAGRFTEHLVRHAKFVVALDLSEAIFSNAALGTPNLVAAQADLMSMPRMNIRFDFVICRGVLQHTPDPKQAIELIHEWAVPGGEVVFDIYGPGRLGRLGHKYMWRIIVQNLFTYDSFSAFLDRFAEPLLRIRWSVKPYLPGKSKRILDYLIPVWDYKNVLPLSHQQLIEWSKLDTLDAMLPKYDQPMTYQAVMSILEKVACEIISADSNLNFFRTRAVRDQMPVRRAKVWAEGEL